MGEPEQEGETRRKRKSGEEKSSVKGWRGGGGSVGEGRRMREGEHHPASRLSSLFPSFCTPPRVCFSFSHQVSDAAILSEPAGPRRRSAPQNSAPAFAERSSITCRAPPGDGAITQPRELQPERTQQRRDGGYGGGARTGRSLDCAHQRTWITFLQSFLRTRFPELC